jgi:hypothetical protein
MKGSGISRGIENSERMATRQLREYIIKGFTLDDERLKQTLQTIYLKR